jgi:hypothetical protein
MGYRRIYLPIVLATAVIAALAVGTALAQPQGPPEEQTICHKPGTPAQKTMTLPQPAAEAHLRHGDTAGPCPTGTPTPTPVPPTPTLVPPTPTPTPVSLADLAVLLPEPPLVFNCDSFNQCDHVVQVLVGNLGDASSNQTDLVVSMNNGLGNVHSVPPLPPHSSIGIEVFVGRGFNCLDLAACITTVQVDPGSMVIESNETNNTATRTDF